MGGTTVVGTDPPNLSDEFPDDLHQTRWQRFLRSWQLGAMLAIACVLGLIAIIGAHPFAPASISSRVSSKLGKPASCIEVGATQVAGKHSTIYRCTIGVETQRGAECFTITGGEVRQLSGTRELGC